jgi:hypothetical protein
MTKYSIRGSDSTSRMAKNFVLEMSIFACNLVGGILVTRSVSLNDKSLLVMTSTIPSIYIALFVSRRVEYILRGYAIKKDSPFAINRFVLYIVCVAGLWVNSNFPLYILVIIALIAYFSSSNATSLASVYLNKGKLQYSTLRLLHVCVIQMGNILYVSFFREFTIVLIPCAYLTAEILLSLVLRIGYKSGSSSGSKQLNESRYQSFSSYLSTTLGANYELFLIAIISVFGGSDWLAYMAVALSITSPFHVLSIVLIPVVLSRNSSVLLNRFSKRFVFFGIIFVTFLFLGFSFSSLDSRIIELVFGPNYQYLAIDSQLLIFAGLFATFSRVIDSLLRKNFAYTSSSIINLMSFALFIGMMFHSQPSPTLNRNFLFICLFQFLVFILTVSFQSSLQSGFIRHKGEFNNG